MAEFSAMRFFSARRAMVIVAVVLAGGLWPPGWLRRVEAAARPPRLGGTGSVGTAAVVRTTLTTTVQVGGSIGFNGSYTIAAPSGTSAAQVTAAQQAVTQDQQTLSADEQAGSDTSAASNQAIAADQASIGTDQAALAADQAQENKACAGTGASSTACGQDKQAVRQDQATLTQAQQKLAADQLAAKAGNDQSQAKVAGDQAKLQADQATLAADQATAINPGTAYTWLPGVGQVIRQDQRVYSVSNVPVPLLYGSIPAYRAFYAGMSDGGDVGELTQDLIALGYGQGLAPSDHYSAAAAAAVDRWQQALGLPVTGQILLGEVVFEPGPIRVTSVSQSAGASAAGGSAGGGSGGAPVLTATGVTPVVTVALNVTQEYLVKPGDAVSVVLPDGTSAVGGQVESVGSVATCPGGGSTGTAAGSGSSPCASAGSNGGSGSNSSATVTVTITLDHTPPGAALDQAPVNVNITSQKAANVLAVPVNALLALAGGGYGVDVVTGHNSRLVRVSTGMYNNTLVQISGPGITAGERVEVPSS